MSDRLQTLHARLAELEQQLQAVKIEHAAMRVVLVRWRDGLWQGFEPIFAERKRAKEQRNAERI